MKRIFTCIMMIISMACFCACSSSENTGSGSAAISQGGSGEQTVSQDNAAAEDGEDTAAGSQAAENEQSGTADTIVVYFSATGTTKGVAERIASVTAAEICEIVPAEPYTDSDLDWNDGGSRSTIEMNDPGARPQIASQIPNVAEYDTVYIGYPIWWGEAPRIMSTFVESCDFGDAIVIPFCTSGGSGVGASAESLASQAGGGSWQEGTRLDGGISEEEIEEWISGL